MTEFGNGIWDEAIAKAALDPTAGERTSTPPTGTAGVPGTPIYGGYVVEFEDNASLTGREKYRTYAKILANTSIVAAAVRYAQNLVSNPGWRAEPADDSAEAQRLADLVTEMFGDMRTPMKRVVKRAFMFKYYGFSLQEITMKVREDGAIGVGDIAPRAQRTIEKWDVDEHGEVLGVWQQSPQDGTEHYIPRLKLLYLVDDSLDDSPEGLGLFRHIAETNRRLERMLQLEGWGYETDLRGIPIGRAPIAELDETCDNEAEKTAALQAIKTFMDSHIRGPQLGLLLDSETYETEDEAARPSNIYKWAVDLLKAPAGTQAEVLRSIDRLNREIARVLGVEQLLLGDNGVGSFAMAREKSHNFAMIIDSAIDEIREALTRDVVRLIFQLNGWDMKLLPKLKTDKLQHRTVEEVTTALRDLAAAGAPLAPGDPAADEVRDMIGVSRQPEDVADLMLTPSDADPDNQSPNDGDDQ